MPSMPLTAARKSAAACVAAFLIASTVLAAKPKTAWTPRVPEYIRSSRGAITSAGKDSGGYWVIVDPIVFFKADADRQQRMVAYTFRNVVPERLHEKTQMRVMQEKGDGEFGPKVGLYSQRLGLKMLVTEAVAEKPKRQAKEFEASPWGGRD